MLMNPRHFENMIETDLQACIPFDKGLDIMKQNRMCYYFTNKYDKMVKEAYNQNSLEGEGQQNISNAIQLN